MERWEQEKLSGAGFSLLLFGGIIRFIEVKDYEKETDKRNHKSFV